jgi:hypothetical protein
VVARIGRALGGCGGLVLDRAIVRDRAAVGQAASRMALLTMVQSLAPGAGSAGLSAPAPRGGGPPGERVSESPKHSVQRLPVDDFEPLIIDP